ncbi:hypothetical protein [Halalkalicoccus jeotgali]|uniref:Enolase n=1 Tax=Halalkalicoccus jeotgali (strain DSM 18796 / CECT 7217 / JCM 14584 / KCTC 4019 / B3) TaxID=795797 RepID=D8J402_HALJB|nr:hypothetical protein [Halalkalicoccus jeotgali]ADJ15394.1 hypothetical protein HacjB3_10055 [Halalkalicoccus jeotgali B3]ELY35830.1 hypothetical protein C497_12616 [Halalkalicoccus jeotgali B3]
MALYDAVSDLSLEIEDVSLARRERDTSSGFTRVSTVISLSGASEEGRGEDVTYEAADHDALLEAGPPDLAGEYTIAEFSERLDDLELFPEGPSRPDFVQYRRWGFESAALDIALRQADTDLASELDREYEPVRFIASTRLGEPPTFDRIERFLENDPDLAFKLDPTSEWDEALIERLAETGAVRVVDLKGQYEGTEVDQAPDPDLYERVIEGLSEAVIEDPALTSDTRPVLEGHEERVSWDATIHGLTDVESLPWEPNWLNIKPSRFGSIESLFETIEFCDEHDITMYGGGQFELDVGRGQIQAIASLFYPDSANDVAPGAYNDPEIPDGLPTSPLSPPAEHDGFRW